ncbi:MAG TPA: ATP-binding cassette domain-containing protein [Nocardioides sp.]|uniref:ATP-binding cassette domain-containing protein n=1 Tax=Nocardioides sp. TaxID=35761 RepID=UPI002E3288EC|nr:ATP-binding cassette domain-containing protein [Nocardioides sp.]HEX5088087.1 ATP-binding cassette domain-containing protein [Nocardioides sp.]
MSEILLTAREVTRSYDVRGRAVLALRPTSLTLAAGDVLAVTGPSGTGKSTLVSILAGWDRPSSGTVERPARTVFVPQRLALIDTLTVLDNIAVAALDRADEVPALAAALAVDHLLDRFPNETSLGERQRIGVARALHARAAVTLLDEPTAHQDAEHTSLVLDAVAAPPPGSAVVVATHDPVVVEVATAVVHLEAATVAS